MKKTGVKILVLVMIIFLVSMTFISIGAEQLGFSKTLEVWYGAVKVNYNNLDLTRQLQPVVINGVTYLPLSKVSNTFNKSVSWNNATKTITLKDKESLEVNDLKRQLSDKEARIEYLENKLNVLKDVLNDGTIGRSTSRNNYNYNDDDDDDIDDELDDIEDDLNDDYDEYNDVDLEYSLSYKNNKVVVEIDTDKDDWEDDLSSGRRKTIYKNVCEEIQDNIDDADIRGFVKDGSRTVAEFYTSFEGKPVEGKNDVGDIEDELNEKLIDNDFGRLDDIDNDDLYIELDGDEDDIKFYINIDLDDYDDEWEDLDKDDIEDFMADIYDEIEDENYFDDADIEGYFYDTDDSDRLVKCVEENHRKEYDFYD